MKFRRMEIEEWFDRYQYEVAYDIGESGVKYFSLSDFDLDLSRLHLRYGHHRGNPILRELVARDYEGLSEENVAVTTGASEANFALIVTLMDPDDHMVIEFPNYPSLYEVPRSLGLQYDLLRLDFHNSFRLDVQELESRIHENTKLVILTRPHNPTGSTLTLTELEEVIELVESRGLYLLLDETYRELAFGDVLPPAASLSSKAISVTTMSKAYGLPGIRIGWVAANKEIIERVVSAREQLTICNSIIGEAVAEAALERKDAVLEGVRKRIEGNFEVLRSWFNRQNLLRWASPSGGVVCFPYLGKKTDQLCTDLAERYKTFTVPGFCFGMDEFLRIGFGGDREELTQGLTNLEETLRASSVQQP
ncbi:aminotransferase class I/II-fold pyridoxal phosphate-dependent enzyme [[Eubacterium] cellulosolvens]